MRRRFIPAAVSATLVLAALTGCAASEHAPTAIDCGVPLHPGALSDGVSLTSGGGIDIVGDTTVLNAQLSTLSSDEVRTGAAEPGSVAIADVSIFDAMSGEEIDRREDSPYLTLPESSLTQLRSALSSAESDSVPVQFLIAAALVCAAPGDTLALAITGAQAMASQMALNPLVAVIEVHETFPAGVDGASRGLPSGFPAIAVDHEGQPGVVLPPQGPPASVRTATRIEGTGERITADVAPIGHVLTVSWSGTVVTNTRDSGLVIFGTEADENPQYSFRGELTGIPVGSQLVILDPNDGDPVVHVVDIVAAM